MIALAHSLHSISVGCVPVRPSAGACRTECQHDRPTSTSTAARVRTDQVDVADTLIFGCRKWSVKLGQLAREFVLKIILLLEGSSSFYW